MLIAPPGCWIIEMSGGRSPTLSEAESREEHNKTKYSPIGQTMAELRSFLCLDVGKITEKNEN